MATLGLSQARPRVLAFAPGGVRSDLRLLEVDEKLLQEITANGVVIKGSSEEDEAVLVTTCRTYAMKLVETTNLQLLVRPEDGEGGDVVGLEAGGRQGQGDGGGGEGGPLRPGVGQGLMTQWTHFHAAGVQAPIQVSATNTSHIELVEVAPRLSALRDLLWRRPYGIEDEGPGTAAGEAEGSNYRDLRMAEASEAAAGHTFEELLDAVQSSAGELSAALEAEGALELEGRWRAVDASYLGSLLEVVLLTAEQEGLSLGALREEPLLRCLSADGYHPAVVRHCLKVYGRPCGAVAEAESAASIVSRGAELDGGIWAMDEAKVCVHFAHKVMAERSSMPLSEFLAAWGRSVPYGMTASLDMLKAEALVDGSGAEARISPFPASSLPADPAARFAALFRRRARWEWAHLEPFLAGVKVPGQSAEALLMRFARASQPTPDSPLFYSAR